MWPMPLAWPLITMREMRKKREDNHEFVWASSTLQVEL
jgi:hypothetical protein